MEERVGCRENEERGKSGRIFVLEAVLCTQSHASNSGVFISENSLSVPKWAPQSTRAGVIEDLVAHGLK